MTHVPLVSGDPMAATERAATGGPSTGGQDELLRLHDLHTRLIDMIGGFDKVLEKAEPEFFGVAEEFRTLHHAQAEQVRAMLIGLGAEDGSDGSILGTVNRVVVEMRSWFSEIDRNILDAIAEGERRLIEDFEAALEASPSIERRGRIDRMRGETLMLLRRHATHAL